MVKASMSHDTNFIRSFDHILENVLSFEIDQAFRNANRAASYLRDKLMDGYKNSSAYGMAKVPINVKAKKIGKNRYKNSGGKQDSLYKLGDMAKSIVAKRSNMTKSKDYGEITIEVGFRNSKYNTLAEYHARGTGKEHQQTPRDLWTAVWDKAEDKVNDILLYGM